MRAKVIDAAVRLMAVSTATLVLLAFQPAYTQAGIDTAGDGQQTPAQLPGSGDRPVNDLTRGGTKTGTKTGTKAGTKTGTKTGTGGTGTPSGTATTHNTGTNKTGPTTATGGANTPTGTATEGDTVGEEGAGGQQQQTTVGGVQTPPATGQTGQQVGAQPANAGQVGGQQAGPGQMAQPAGVTLGLNQLPSTATSAAGELIAIIGTGAAALYAALRSRR